MPAKQPQPALAMHGDLSQAVAAQVPEAEIVMLPHQRVPARLLVRAHRAHLHLAQANRVSPHFLRYQHGMDGTDGVSAGEFAILCSWNNRKSKPPWPRAATPYA